MPHFKASLKNWFFDWRTKQWSINIFLVRAWYLIPSLICNQNYKNQRYYVYKDRDGVTRRSKPQPFLGLVVELSEEGQAYRRDWWRTIRFIKRCKHNFLPADRWQVEVCNNCGLPKQHGG